MGLGRDFISLYLFLLLWVFVAAHRLSPAPGSGRYSLDAVCVLLIEVASFVLEHSLRVYRLQSLQDAGSAVMAHRLGCPAACRIFPDQGSNQCPLRCKAVSQPQDRQGSPILPILF